MAIANPPQMTEQFSPFKRQQNNPQYEHENDMAYFVRLKEVQEKVTILYPAFPLQAHKDFLVSYNAFHTRHCKFLSFLL